MRAYRDGMSEQGKDAFKLNLLSISDLCDRWGYTKAGVHKLSKGKDFPKPGAIIGKKKIKVFSETDILEYESGKPWLFSERLKISHQRRAFYRTNKKALEKSSV